MLFGLLADATVVLHLAFVVFVLLGGLLAMRRPKLAWVHLPAAAWGACVEFLDWTCPLTPLENWLRSRVGGGTYAGGFVEHYVVPLIYPATLSRQQQLVLGGTVLLANGLVYAALIRRRRREPGRRARSFGRGPASR